MYGGASWALSPERASANVKMGKNLGPNTRGHRYITVPDKVDNLVGFETQQPIHQGIGIGSYRTWITHNAQKRLWLPSEYRPGCSAVSGRCVGIGTGSRKVRISA
jgi:hypothetical protein